MGVLSKCWRGSRRQALRTLRKGLDMRRRRKHGTTYRLALSHQHRRYGEIAGTVRSAPGRDPRMARFIRVLSAGARKSRGIDGRWSGAGNQRRLDISGLSGVFRPGLGRAISKGKSGLAELDSNLLKFNIIYSRAVRFGRAAGRDQVSRGIND